LAERGLNIPGVPTLIRKDSLSGLD